MAPSSTVELVSFSGDEAALAGNVYAPGGREGSRALPGVVVTGTWTSVKEQMTDRYTAKPAERGPVGLNEVGDG